MPVSVSSKETDGSARTFRVVTERIHDRKRIGDFNVSRLRKGDDVVQQPNPVVERKD
jgi:hypothetical protein